LTDPRRAAWRALCDVILKGRSLDAALAEHVDGEHTKDRQSLARALCFQTLRWRHQLEGYRDALLARPMKRKDADLGVLLLLGLAQLEHMRLAPHAVLNETVSLAAGRKRPWARGLINAILRRYQREREQLLTRFSADESVTYSQPAWLLNRWQQDWPQHWQQLAQASNRQAPMTLRNNPRRATREQSLQTLSDVGIEASKGRAEQAIYLHRAQSVEDLPGFADGALSVQDESAQWAAEWLDLRAGQRVLDACAAPGGKSAAMLERADIDLLAIDNQASRVALIESTMQRLQLPASTRWQAICADAGKPEGWLDGREFDRILLDAPCSATGVIRRHPDIKSLRRDEDLNRLAALQADLLEALWPSLVGNGLLLYATCSTCRVENHQRIGAFLAAHPDAELRPLPDLPNALSSEHGLQCLPVTAANIEGGTPDDGDGFFYALLQKRH
jgi:16S rRNA (cytosine967-C5)-methyltransferase